MDQSLRALVSWGALVLVLAACAVPTTQSNTAQTRLSMIVEEESMPQPKPTIQAAAVAKRQFQRAAEISSRTWINSKTLNWNELRGKVVVVDFWTFACYNCKNTLPYFKAWDEKYRAQGLVVLGVHTPELSFEKDVENVRNAVKDYQIQYPVAIDGDYANWNRYSVRAWPTWFIVDKEGYIRYSHIGEGAYARSERVIQELLAE
ncbi:MAG: redoxin domain-containing protein [Chloroflexi bacterium]|nr:redoxin domain-containing protein [Chloroflexota bacterium]